MSNKYFSEEFIKVYNDYYKQIVGSSTINSEHWTEAMKPLVTLADSFQSYRSLSKIGLNIISIIKESFLVHDMLFQGTYKLLDVYKAELQHSTFASDAYKVLVRDLQDNIQRLHESQTESSALNVETLSANLVDASFEDFTYTIDSSNKVEYSAPLENVVDDIVESVYDDNNRPSDEKIHNKEFFLVVLLPLIMMVLSLVFNIGSDVQASKQLERHHQEEIAIQEKLLQEERLQTEYLKKLSESSSNKTSQEQ